MIYYNHETPQLQFAASEVRAAVAAKSGRLVERALSECNSPSEATAFVIAARELTQTFDDDFIKRRAAPSVVFVKVDQEQQGDCDPY